VERIIWPYTRRVPAAVERRKTRRARFFGKKCGMNIASDPQIIPPCANFRALSRSTSLLRVAVATGFLSFDLDASARNAQCSRDRRSSRILPVIKARRLWLRLDPLSRAACSSSNEGPVQDLLFFVATLDKPRRRRAPIAHRPPPVNVLNGFIQNTRTPSTPPRIPTPDP